MCVNDKINSDLCEKVAKTRVTELNSYGSPEAVVYIKSFLNKNYVSLYLKWKKIYVAVFYKKKQKSAYLMTIYIMHVFVTYIV